MRNFIALLCFAIANSAVWAPPAEATKPAPPIEALTALSLEIPGTVELSWRAVSGVSEYLVSASRETAENWHELGTTTATHYQVRDLRQGTNYYFRITSHSRAGHSAWDGAVVQYSARTHDSRPALLLATNFRVTQKRPIAKGGVPSRNGELALAWNTVSGVKSYVVQICESKQCDATRSEVSRIKGLGKDADFRDLTTVTGTEYLATGLLSGQVYLFRITGIDSKGQRGGHSELQANRAP